MVKKLISLILALGVAGSVAAVNFLQEGEKNLQNDKPKEALVYLEAALGDGPPSEKLLLYLALAYERTGLREEAKKMLKKGQVLAGPQQYLFHYNLGGLEFADGDFKAAEQDFTEASRLRPNFTDALLNRATSRLSLQDWAGAQEDFGKYLVLEPTTPQKDRIQDLLNRLKTKQAAEDEAKALAEAEKAAAAAKQKQLEEEKAAEAARLAQAAEQKRLAEAEQARFAEEQKQAQAAEQARLAEEQRQAEAAKKAEDARVAAEAEKARLAEQQRQAEAARVAEEQRQAEEARLAAEDAKRQAELLARVQTSLLGVSNDSKTLSTGPAGIKKPDEEFTLDE